MKIANLKSKSLAIGIIFLIISCKTYTIPVDSFRTQMINANSENMKVVEINNPLTFGKITYSSNNIRSLVVIDKNGKELLKENKPSIEMRVTDSYGKKYHFYFDTVILENDTLKGARSRYMKNLTREIPLNSIVKIEVQDGGKNFKYQDK